MKKILTLALCVCTLSAFAGGSKPFLIADYDRNGKIDFSDYGRMEKGEPFVIWLNDDDDADGAEADDGKGNTNVDLHDVPSGEDNDRDCDDEQVNGHCDLLDFFPVLIDVDGVDEWGSCTWELSSKSVNVVFTPLKAYTAGDFHTQAINDFGGETPLYRTTVVRLVGEDGAEAELPAGFLEHGRGVVIIEGAALGSEGLTLRGYRNKEVVVEATMNLTVAPVEEMYRWLNLRPKQADESRLEEPAARPDAESDGRHFVLVSGYNTNHEEARGNAAEFYKKLWQSGADVMFTAVEWYGDRSQMRFELLGVTFSPNYFVNVENAFAAARPFAEACARLPGEKILVGHSLGNMLISSAIKDYGLDYTKYVMLNAAVAREAYDASAYDKDMVSVLWEDAEEERLRGDDTLTNHLDRAARWYRNFKGKEYDPYEYRRKLAWRGRFANLPRTVNYYSPTDNILANPAHPDTNDLTRIEEGDPKAVREVLSRTIRFGGFWSLSEKLKGRPLLIDTVNGVLTNVFGMAAADVFKCEGGWGENPDYTEGTAFSPTNTHFTPFLDARMKTIGMLDILPAETERLRAQHLADAIPAESFAAGANPVATLANVNMEGFIGENPDWPVKEEESKPEWKHSTFREVAFYHTSKLYASLVAVAKPRVIIDTDLGSSMDDLFAIDLAARMHKAGKLELMAVMMDRPDGHDPEQKGEFLTFADRYLASLGLDELPIGKSISPVGMSAPQYVFNPYWSLIYSNNLTGVGLLLPTNRTPEQIASFTDAVTLYRRLLDDAQPKSVIICSTGFLSNLRELMMSAPNYEGDEIRFSGMELIAAKVKELRIMGGCFDPESAPDGAGGAEYNFAGDPEAAKLVVEGWPSPVVLSPWEVGLKLDYPPDEVLKDFPAGTFNPVVRAAHTYWPSPLRQGDLNRLWDPMTVLPLVEGEMLVPLSEQGGIAVDGKGRTTFIPNASSNRCYQVASNMNASAVMNRFRAICRTGNPSARLLVSGKPEPGIDYNGSELVFKFEDFRFGGYEESDLKFRFTVDGREYSPDSLEWDETLEVLSVRFVIPPEAATAGNVYTGELKVVLTNETIGENVLLTASRQLVQGALVADQEMPWFYEAGLKAPTNFVPTVEIPEKVTARVKTTVNFAGEPFEERFLSAAETVQAAVRIVDDEAGGYRFQFYAFTEGETEDLREGWWDSNISNVVPVAGNDYEITAELMYRVDAERQLHSVAFSVKNAGDNRPALPVFLGNLIGEGGDIGNAGWLGSVAFTEPGEDIVLDGVALVNKVDMNLAQIDGEDGYATVAEAVDAAKGRPVRLLHAASWHPSEAVVGGRFGFLNKSWLVLDLSALPPGTRAVWTEVDGNNGVLRFGAPVTPVTPIVCDTAAAASNRMAKAVFAPSVEVEEKLGAGTAALGTYCGMFTLEVVPTTDGKWAVAAMLTEAAEDSLAETLAEAARQIPLVDIAAMTTDGKKDVPARGCVPGFYYTLQGAGGLEVWRSGNEDKLDAYGPELCGADGEVTFPGVKKPSEKAGFFAVGVKAAPDAD